MKVSVERLFGSDVEAIEVDQDLQLPGDLGERYPAGVRLAAKITHITRGVYLEGTIDGTERETCVRCLEPFERHTHINVAEPFSEDVAPADAPFSDVAPLVDRLIDVDDLVTQLLEVDEPMAAVCRENCLGICSSCGANRNVESCNCATVIVDERLAGLAKFLEEADG